VGAGDGAAVAAMNTPKNHHYVPVFYLKKWVGQDGKIQVFRGIRGKLESRRLSPESTGFEVNLYSYSSDFKTENPAEVETEFYSRLDNEGARIIEILLQGGDLSDKQKTLWAQFVLNLKVRNPETVSMIKEQYTSGLLSNIQASEEKYRAQKKPNDPEKLAEYIEQNHPGFISNAGLGQIPKIGSYQQALDDFTDLIWLCLDVSKSSRTLLTSDRPLIFPIGLHRSECVVALPLSPTHAFFAFHANSINHIAIMRETPDKLAAQMNRYVTNQSDQRVYARAANDVPQSFLLKHMKSLK
jgi:hypothetical protein